jgi:5-methylcytosine-specific restriction endonuclease McrA
MCSSAQVRAAVFALEGGKCTACGMDCHALFEQARALDPPQRLNKLLSAGWRLPKSARALENLLQNPKEGDFWQVDHIRAVSEGGGGCGLENLRTLCVPCHNAETETLRSRLRLAGPDRLDESKRKLQPSITSFLDGYSKKTRKGEDGNEL